MANPFLATFTITPSTGAMALSGGILAAGKTIAVTVNTSAAEQALDSPFTFDAGDTYRLTVKRPGRHTGAALTYIALTRVSGTQATGELDLTGTEFYDLIGTARTCKVGISIDHVTYGLAAVEDDFTLYNTFRRPADTSPGNSSENAYTDDEIDALMASVATLSDATPEALGEADSGTGEAASREDHVHAMPSAADVGADATGTASGLMSTHTTTHPAPTSRDTRNEAADSAIQTHITGTGSPHTAAGVGAATSAQGTNADTAVTVPGTAKTVPADADVVTWWDSAATWARKNLSYANLLVALRLLFFGITVGTTLPTSGHSVYCLAVLTATDATAKAGAGLYWHDETGWLCLWAVPYAFGDLGATPTLALITGGMYTWTVSAEITGATITMSRPGHCSFVSMNGSGNAWIEGNTTATDRTIKDVEGSFFGSVADTAGMTGTITDDGTNLWLAAGADA